MSSTVQPIPKENFEELSKEYLSASCKRRHSMPDLNDFRIKILGENAKNASPLLTDRQLRRGKAPNSPHISPHRLPFNPKKDPPKLELEPEHTESRSAHSIPPQGAG